MTITIKANEMRKALLAVKPAFRPMKKIPIMDCVRFFGNGDEITVTATDLDMELSYKIDVGDPIENFDVCVHYRTLLKYVTLIKGRDAVIEASNDGFSVNGLSFDTLPSVDFPEFPPFGDAAQSTIVKGARIKPLLHAISKEKFHYYLHGINHRVDADYLDHYEVTDGHRLAVSKLGQNGHGKCSGAIIPRNMCKVIASQEHSKLLFCEKQVMAISGNITGKSKLIDGTFPPVAKVIPDKTAHIVTFSSAELMMALKTLLVFWRKPYYCGFIITKHNNGAEISLHEGKKSKVDLNCEWSSEVADGFKVGFNIQYMIDAIECVGRETLTIHFNEPNGPVIIGDDGIITYVLMPTRI